MKPRVLLVLAILAPSRSGLAADVESLGQPCRAKQILGTALVTDRQDGRERFFLLNDNESYGCEILSIDFEKNTGEAFSAPAGAGSWCGIEVPGDKFVVGTFYDGAFMVFDLKSRKFDKVAKFPGESYIWKLAIGVDGRVYGGTYPGGKLGALDVEKGTVEDLGAPAKPNQYLRTLSAAPWGDIFCNFGMAEPTSKAFDVKSKTWRDIPGLKSGQTLGVGVSWNGFFVVNDPRSGRVEAFRDATLKRVEPRPFPEPKGSFTLDAQLSNIKTLYLRQGRTLYSFAAGGKLVRTADLDSLTDATAAIASDGTLLGVRGQAYFARRTGAAGTELRPIPVEAKGRPPLFLKADQAGRIWGGPHFGQTLFYYDTRTGNTVNTDTICDAGGEVYGVTFHKGIVYAASYAGGDITAYDPSQPWDQLGHKNPRPLDKVGPKYIRPEGGIVTGLDGRLYAGWMARYGTYGGAISMTDPATGKTDLIENPFGEQAIISVAADAEFVYAGTSLGGNGLPHQKGQTKFGVIDIATHKVLFERAFAGHAVSRITVEPKTGLVAFTVGSHFRLYEPKEMKILENPIPDMPSITAHSIEAASDGTLVTAVGKVIISIDLATGGFKRIGEVSSTVNSVTRSPDGRLYFNCGADLYRTTMPAP